MPLKSESGSFWGRVDLALVLPVVGLIIFGTIAIVSAASPLSNYHQILQRHFFALFLGFGAFLLGSGINYQIFQDQSKSLYALMIFMMICVVLFGATVRGHRAWFRLPFFSFQPAELARVWLILVLGNYMDRRGNRIWGIGTIFGVAGIVIPVMALVLMEPDYSSALVMCPVILSLLFVAGANVWHLLMLTCYGAICALMLIAWTVCILHPELIEISRVAAFVSSISKFNASFLLAIVILVAAFYIGWRLAQAMRLNAPWFFFAIPCSILIAGLCTSVFINGHIKDYQRKRFMAFLDPSLDPQGATYHVNQALVAIGSGGVHGKGIFSGTQSQLGFLPERHTDFVFAVIGEEMGFMGSATMLILYLFMIYRIIHAAEISRDRYGCLVCAGVAAMFTFYLLVNVGMCLGVMPVAGIPLPFVSYGGSSLVVNLWALGIVGNIYSKRYAFF